MSGDSNISNEKMNIVSAMNSAYSYMNNVTIGFTEDQITYFKLLTKPLDDSMEQENNGTDSQITVDISHILGNLITVIFDYQILRKPLKILSL